MARFILFTKTTWDEPPRLRHQFAELLAGAGHEVIFFEKPTSTRPPRRDARQRATRITALQNRELMHHKLRMSPLLQRANAAVTARSIARRLAPWKVTDADTVISFNYDYWFLRRVFPRNRILTVINDDFICVALFGYTKPLLWALERTCEASDRVLTVSVPLMRQLEPYTTPELFLPWADQPYRAPASSSARDTLLFWGYINRRLHFPAILAHADALASSRPDVRLLFVGPIAEPQDASTIARIAEMRRRPNIEFAPSSRLDDLPLQRVLAAYIPYRPDDGEIDAITLSNKGLQLLARGLPILVSAKPAMPNFIEKPFVARVAHDAPALQVDELRASFERLQPSIAAFVAGNGPDARLAQLLGAGSAT